ncbi:MAG: type IV pilus secretin PilQ family protein [Gammaproteobacteria bacterium]|nr:type IV pilus secretin PilQ family protein [Gammaproteobacteria bacterium]
MAGHTVVAAVPATLDDIAFTALPGGGFEAKLSFSEGVDKPVGYVIESPPRMVFDFPNAKSALAQKKYALSFDIAKSAVVVTSGDRTRLIFNLRETVGYDVKSEGHSVSILVGDGNGRGAAREQYASSASEPNGGPAGAGATLTTLDFQRGDGGEGLVTVGLGKKDTGIDVSQVGKNIVVMFSHTSLPESLNRKLDVIDFATPVKSVDTTADGSATKMVIEAVGEYDYLAYQADNNYVVSVKPLTREQEDERRKTFQYTGEKLSLNFQNIEVRALLQLIADFSDFNLVASDAVNGSITLRLKNVPWDQALDIILKAKGLDKRVDGNVLMVAPAAEIAERERLQVEANKQLQELAPLRTEYIRIRYADARKLFDLFNTDNKVGSGGGGGGSNSNENATGSILSERGNAIVDERTNTIILTDTEDKIAEFRRIVQQIDIPVRQVEIEARIVVANTDFRKQLGARWGVAAVRKGSNSLLEVTGQRVGLDSEPGSPAQFFGNGGTLDMSETLAVDLGVAKPTGSIALGLMRNNTFLDLELSALQNDGYGEIISQPKVITSDKKKATIKSGVEIPYQQSSSAGNTNISFKDAVLKLEVTPLITPDNRIVMTLTIAQDSIGKFVPSGNSGGQVPTIDTTNVETEALVGDGQTLVLGGIFKMESLDSVEKVPVLGDLPVVGRLFRHTSKDQKKQEILIFITPKIMNDLLLDQ